MQIGNLDGLGDIPPRARQEVVSPSQSAFGLRAYEDEGEDGEGEAPSEVEEDQFDDEGEDAEDDWDTVSVGVFCDCALEGRVEPHVSASCMPVLAGCYSSPFAVSGFRESRATSLTCRKYTTL